MDNKEIFDLLLQDIDRNKYTEYQEFCHNVEKLIFMLEGISKELRKMSATEFFKLLEQKR